MGSSSKKIIIATEQVISGCKRKLAWFKIHKRDLYFEMAAIMDGSHSSYHKDGSIWRTSPATNKKPKLVKRHYPLNNLRGWFPLGIGMLLKTSLPNNPKLKDSDKKHDLKLVDIDLFPSDSLNIVVDIVDISQKNILNTLDMLPPKDALLLEFTANTYIINVTLLGHDHNLLVCPYDVEFKGVTCRHFNKRYSASPPGGVVEFEAYKK